MTKIAVDICGGDWGSAPVLVGVRSALKRDANLQVELYGDAAAIASAQKSESFTADQRQRIQIHTCDTSVTMEDRALQVLRHKSNSSMALAISAVADGECDAALSCGNTAALVALGLQHLGTIEGVTRPAICTALPSSKGRTWFLDMGANLEPSVEQMLANTRMGSVQCRLFDSIEKPRVGIMNVGSERSKGTEDERDLAKLLSVEPGIEFCGFAEGADLFTGEFDLIVCDGFTGNVALKTAEGMSRYLKLAFNEMLSNHWSARICYMLMRPRLRTFRQHMDPANYNGAALLGLNGLLVKSHGSSSSKGIRNAILCTAEMVRKDALKHIRGSIPQALGEISANAL